MAGVSGIVIAGADWFTGWPGYRDRLWLRGGARIDSSSWAKGFSGRFSARALRWFWGEWGGAPATRRIHPVQPRTSTIEGSWLEEVFTSRSKRQIRHMSAIAAADINVARPAKIPTIQQIGLVGVPDCAGGITPARRPSGNLESRRYLKYSTGRIDTPPLRPGCIQGQ